MVFARTSPGFCQDFARVWRWNLPMGRPPNRPLEGQNRASEGQKSSSDRPGDSQEQPKSLQDNKFRVFSDVFEKIWKTLKPKSAQEFPKSGPGAPRRIPESAQEASQGAPGSPRAPVRRLQARKKCCPRAILCATHSRSEFGTICQRFSSRARKGRESSDMRLDS